MIGTQIGTIEIFDEEGNDFDKTTMIKLFKKFAKEIIVKDIDISCNIISKSLTFKYSKNIDKPFINGKITGFKIYTTDDDIYDSNDILKFHLDYNVEFISDGEMIEIFKNGIMIKTITIHKIKYE